MLKVLTYFFFVLFLVFSNAALAIDSMLILGASVSDDWVSPSPGRRIAEQFGLEQGKDFIVVAKGGMMSTYHDKFIRKELPKLSFDYIIAVDLFFWDFRFATTLTVEKEAVMRMYVDRLAQHGRQVYIGSPVDWLFLGGPSEAETALREIAAEYENVHVVDMNGYYKALHSKEGYNYKMNGQNFTVWRHHVLADILHPNDRGSKMLTNFIIQQIFDNDPTVSRSELPFHYIEPPWSKYWPTLVEAEAYQ